MDKNISYTCRHSAGSVGNVRAELWKDRLGGGGRCSRFGVFAFWARRIHRTRHKFSDCIALYFRLLFLNFTLQFYFLKPDTPFKRNNKTRRFPTRTLRIGYQAQHRGWRFSRDLYRRKSPVHTSWKAEADKNGKGNSVVSCALGRESQNEDFTLIRRGLYFWARDLGCALISVATCTVVLFEWESLEVYTL